MGEGAEEAKGDRLSLELRIALERLVYLQQIREHVLRSFGASKNPRDRLHNRELTHHVAEAMRREYSPSLRRDVIQAMVAHGWRYVTHARIAWWKGIAKL